MFSNDIFKMTVILPGANEHCNGFEPEGEILSVGWRNFVLALKFHGLDSQISGFHISLFGACLYFSAWCPYQNQLSISLLNTLIVLLLKFCMPEGVVKGPFHKWFMSSQLNFCENSLHCYFICKGSIKSQFCTCHDSSLWPHHVLIFHLRPICICTKFGS